MLSRAKRGWGDGRDSLSSPLEVEQTHRSKAWAMTTLAAILDQGGGKAQLAAVPPTLSILPSIQASAEQRKA